MNKFAELIYNQDKPLTELSREYIQMFGADYDTINNQAGGFFKNGVKYDTKTARNWAKLFGVNVRDILEDKETFNMDYIMNFMKKYKDSLPTTSPLKGCVNRIVKDITTKGLKWH